MMGAHKQNLYLTIIYIIIAVSISSCVSPTRGNYFKKSQNYEQAIMEYNYVLKQNPDNYAANLGLGDIYFERREFDKASLYYDRAALTKPHNTEIKKKISKVIAIFEKVDELMKEGNNYFSLKDYLKAQAKYKEILDFYPDHEKATAKLEECKGIIDKAALFFSKGAASERDGDLQKAFDNYSKSYYMTPNNEIYKKKVENIKEELGKSRASIDSGLDSMNMGNFNEAISTLEKRSEIDKKSDEVYFHLAEAYSKAAQKKENSNEKLSNLKIALAKLENVSKGSIFYQGALELQKKILLDIEEIEEIVEARMRAAKSYYEKKMFSKALENYESIIVDFDESRFVPECKKQEVLCQIDEILITSRYQPLPILESNKRGESNVFKDVVIELKNETPYKLQFLYYGSDSGFVEIGADSAIDISFTPGKYKLAAKLFGKKIHHFAQEEDLSRGKFSILFYEKSKK
ncbi:tetratricopeptide repeat protein [bacterium]|nr:tetratricopeptide repeat protein [bacterium]